MKHIATHTASNTARTKIHMWRTDGGHTWCIGVLHDNPERVGVVARVIFHCGSETYIRGLWRRDYS